jgi:undecaprenyl-diphosphatase
MNQYDLWPGFSELLHYNAIFVTIDDIVIPQRVAGAFEKVDKRLFTVYEKDKKVRDYSVFLCYDFKGMTLKKPGTY